VLPAAVGAAAPVFADAFLAAQREAVLAAGLVVASAVAEEQSREAARGADSAAAVCARRVAQVSLFAVAASAARLAPFAFPSGGAARAEAESAVERPRGVAAVK